MVIEMDQNIQKPSIRFKGFTDTWEQYELSDIMLDFIVPMRDKPKEFGGEIPWTRIEDIEGKYLNGTKSDQYVSESIVKMMNLKIIPRNSLIVSASATFGVAAIVNTDLITNQTFIGLVPREDYDIDFLYYLFYSSNVVRQMALKSAGSTIFYISRDQFKNMLISAPKLDEQIKVGMTLSGLDNLITLHQRKYDKLVNTKKALLDKTFPKAGKVTPKLRFRGFTDAWEQCEFKEIFNYERPDMFIVSNEEYSNTYSIPVLTANKGFILGYTNETRTYNKPCIIFDDFTLDSKYVDFPFMVKSSAMKILTNKEGFDLRFSHELLNSVKIENLGHARHYISIVQPTIVRAPKLSEQKEISELFRSIDSLITLHQRKHEKLKNIKKALLQKMFV